MNYFNISGRRILSAILVFFSLYSTLLVSEEIEILKVSATNENSAKEQLLKSEPAIEKNTDRTFQKRDISDWLYNISIASFGGSNSGTRNEFNKSEDIEKGIIHLKENGVNTIILNGLLMHLCFLDKWEMRKENTRKIVSIAHKHGIKVIEHHDVPVIYNAGTGFEYFIKHLDWAQKNLQFNEVTHNMCLNNPDFKKEYLKRLKDFVDYTGVDGVMLDECYFAEGDYCSCDYCRSKFNIDTGLSLPSAQKTGNIMNRTNTLWLNWLKWRVKSTGDWWSSVRKTLDESNRDISIFIYTTDSGLLYGTFPRQSYDFIESSQLRNFNIGSEVMPRNVFDCYRGVFSGRKLFSAFAATKNRPVFAWIYTGDPNIAYFGWALCEMNRQSACIEYSGNINTSKYANWPYKMQKAKVEPIADAAVLFSLNSRYPKDGNTHCEEAIGLSQCLTDYHILHDIIFDKDITIENIKKYKLVILGNCLSLKNEHLDIIKKYISQGGIVVITGLSAILDEEGKNTGNFILSDIMNVTLTSIEKKPVTVESLYTDKPVSYNDTFAVVEINKEGLSKICGNIKDLKGNSLSPAVIETVYGKGKIVYVNILPGKVNAQSVEEMTGREFKFKKNQDISQFLKNIIETSFDDCKFKTDAPEKLLFTAYTQRTVTGECISLHFLNATSANLAQNEIIPDKKAGIAFPSLKENISVTAKLEGKIKDIYMVSPDYPEKRKVRISTKDSNNYQLIIPKENIVSYSVIFITLEY